MMHLYGLHQHKHQQRLQPSSSSQTLSSIRLLLSSAMLAMDQTPVVGDPIAAIRNSSVLRQRREKDQLTEFELTALQLMATLLACAGNKEIFLEAAMDDLDETLRLICEFGSVVWSQVKKRTTMHSAILFVFLEHVRPVMEPYFSGPHMSHLLDMIPEFRFHSEQNFQALCEFADCIALASLVLPLPANKLVHMEVVSWLATNVTVRYVPGGGQTQETSARVKIYGQMCAFFIPQQPQEIQETVQGSVPMLMEPNALNIFEEQSEALDYLLNLEDEQAVQPEFLTEEQPDELLHQAAPMLHCQLGLDDFEFDPECFEPINFRSLDALAG